MNFLSCFFRTSSIGLLTLTVTLSQSANAMLVIPDGPIFLGGNVQPNIMFAVDDSGSMNWEVLLSQGALAAHAGATNGFNLDISPNNREEDREFCVGYNVLAYNPAVTYTPWIGSDDAGNAFDNASITAARIDPYDTSRGSRNLLNADGTRKAMIFGNWIDADNDDVYDAGECPTAGSNGGFAGRNHTNDARFVSVATLGTAPDPNYINPRTGLNHSQQTNFANWYQYYRKREFVLKRAMSQLIDSANSRMGLASMHNNNNIGIPIRDMTVSANKDALLEQMFRIDSSFRTPLRRLLNNVGRYFEEGIAAPTALGSRFSSEPSPFLPAADGGECQQNFTVLMSDGFWNSTFTGNNIGNADGDNNTIFDGGPHADGFSLTLADVAMHYYERDLAPSLDNFVPTDDEIDNNDAQHMVTYAVSFGLQGTPGLTTPVLPNGNYDHNPATPPPPPTGWPQPISDTLTTLDDMQHAAFNGRGLFLNADNPQNLISSLTNAVSDIDTRSTLSGATVSLDSAALSDDSRIFIARFNTEDYSGSLRAISVDGNGVIGAELWDAANGLSSSSGRDLYTIVKKSGTDTPIVFAQTDTELLAAVTSSGTSVPGDDIINYIRGVRSLEVQSGGKYRNRNTLLGDIIGGSPVTVTGNASFGYDRLSGTPGSSYPAYLNSKASTYSGTPDNAVVLVGANDGVLHAFNANSGGNELFGYIPKTVHENLHLLTTPNYGHKFYLNSTGKSADAYLNGWKTVFVSGLGEGGRGIFALDITNPFSGGNPALWEKNSNDLPAVDYQELGFIKHQPVIVPLNNGDWGVIVGNGYNSQSQTAQLFILDLSDGSIIKRISTNMGGTSPRQTGKTNGLAEPLVLDLNGDRLADVVYAGDLLGNLWKFDISDTNPTNWGSPFGSTGSPDPLFTATDPSSGNPQPITTAPSFAVHPDDGFIIVFGTGKYIENTDNKIPNPDFVVSSMYGIQDDGNNITNGRAALQKQTVTSTGTNPIRREVSNTQVNYATDKGWFIDFDDIAGEMVIANPDVILSKAIFNTYVPSNSTCSFGGSSFLFVIDAINGGRTQNAVFDFDNDGTADPGNTDSAVEIPPTLGGPGLTLAKDGTDKSFSIDLETGDPNNPTGLDLGRDRVRRTSWRLIEEY